MSLTSLECQVSELVHSDTRPRPTTPQESTVGSMASVVSTEERATVRGGPARGFQRYNPYRLIM